MVAQTTAFSVDREHVSWSSASAIFRHIVMLVCCVHSFVRARRLERAFVEIERCCARFAGMRSRHLLQKSRANVATFIKSCSCLQVLTLVAAAAASFVVAEDARLRSRQSRRKRLREMISCVWLRRIASVRASAIVACKDVSTLVAGFFARTLF